MNNQITIPVKTTSEGAVVPASAYNGDAGYDLVAVEKVVLRPFERKLVNTGLMMEIPDGYAGFVLPRSGLAIREGLSLVNTPGLIDSNYRGEIKAIAINLNPDKEIVLPAGTRIAQLVIMKVESVNFNQVDELSDSDRGTGGFGSSGIQS